MLRRHFLKSLDRGSGVQLLYLLFFCLGVLLCLILVAYLFFDDGTIAWQEVVGLFLDPGVFNGRHTHDVFRLIVALVGVFSFSSLLISMFTNIISNRKDAFRNGEVKFGLKNHILIIGSGERLLPMLLEIDSDKEKRDVIIMTSSSVIEMRQFLEHELKGSKVLTRLLFYHGISTVQEDLAVCSPWTANIIFVLGENTFDDCEKHDSSNIRTVAVLKDLCKKSKRTIPCFVMMDDDLSIEIIRCLSNTPIASRLKVDFIPANEYVAEQLLVYTDFLPAIGKDSDKRSHIIIIGDTSVARAVATVAANISHYPNFNNGECRTTISFIAADIRGFMEKILVSRKNLFELCHWKYISESKTEESSPTVEMGDYIDIDWQFVDADPESFFARDFIAGNFADSRQICSVIAAGDSVSKNMNSLLHLPGTGKSRRLAAYLPASSHLLDIAVETGVFGEIMTFGPSSKAYDALCLKRSLRGKRVNFFYDQNFSDLKSSDIDEAWYKIPEAHKFSSIYCADAIPLRIRSMAEIKDCAEACEVEHRRWMLSVLLMGYSALPLSESAAVRADKSRFKTLKAQFVHADIAPFDHLSQEEKNKDLMIIGTQCEIIK